MKVYKKTDLTDVLDAVLQQAGGKPMTIKAILLALAGKGHPVIIIFLALPFCLPIQIPGLSTPFGIVISLLALRMVISHQPWLPKKVLEKEVSFNTIETVVGKAKAFTLKAQKFVHPRLIFLVENPLLFKLHGFIICYLGFVLALPLPIPLSNLLAGYPIILIALGIIEDDGYAVILGYIFTLICTIYLFILIPYGLESLYKLT